MNECGKWIIVISSQPLIVSFGHIHKYLSEVNEASSFSWNHVPQIRDYWYVFTPNAASLNYVSSLGIDCCGGKCRLIVIIITEFNDIPISKVIWCCQLYTVWRVLRKSGCTFRRNRRALNSGAVAQKTGILPLGYASPSRTLASRHWESDTLRRTYLKVGTNTKLASSWGEEFLLILCYSWMINDFIRTYQSPRNGPHHEIKKAIFP